jgi:hypothetical protein
MRRSAQARNPQSLQWLWIPDSRYAASGMTEFDIPTTYNGKRFSDWPRYAVRLRA